MGMLTTRLKKMQQKKEKLFCAYITLGYPSLSFTRSLIPQLEQVGVDILELGIPFSDPLADGPTIQEASFRSLKKKTNVHDAFTMVKQLRDQGVTIPIVFFSYYNPILKMGTQLFVKALTKSGFDGVICPDLPLGENEQLEAALRKNNIAFIQLVAPTTEKKRLPILSRKSKGFVYYVARRGVTGKQNKIASDLKRNVKSIKQFTKTPVLVGFGVSDKKQVKTIAQMSDGVIVGSAIVDHIGKYANIKKTASFVKRLVDALKQAS